MPSQNVARRYLPLAVVVAVQLLIIAVVPSKAQTPSAAASAGGSVQGYSVGGSAGSGSGAGGGSGSLGSTTGGGGTGSSVTSASGTGGGAGPGGTEGGGSAGTGSSGSGTSGEGGSSAPGSGGGATSGSGVTAAGSTAHCVDGREFSPAIDYYAPPCTPGAIGATFANGGSTYSGVSGSTITIVDYVTNYGAEVNAIEAAQGQLETYQEAEQLDAAYTNFINTHYVLWGRKVVIKTYAGQCQSVPPDYSCLESEMDSIVATYHPYAVFWDTSICSACFQTLAQDHVIAFGGEGFSDAFSDANAPYYYSASESSTHMEDAFADWYCNQLQGPVEFAPDKNPAQDFEGKPRVLGVISTNDPDNESTVHDVLMPALKADCGVNVTHTYFYSQDINTAAQQVEAGISAMDTTSSPATDILCLCDTTAPEFLYEGEQQHNYWPENLLADVQGMTLDETAQDYGAGSGNSSSLGCPTPSVGCEWNDAFGLTSKAPEQPQSNNAGTRTYKLGGGTSLPVSGLEAVTVWEDYNMLASLIENTGPDLTPARMQAAAPTMGTLGGGTTGQYQVGFSSGNYNWVQDAEVAYWDPNMPSSYNGIDGTFVAIEGRRFLPNQYGKYSQPPVPAVRPS